MKSLDNRPALVANHQQSLKLLTEAAVVLCKHASPEAQQALEVAHGELYTLLWNVPGSLAILEAWQESLRARRIPLVDWPAIGDKLKAYIYQGINRQKEPTGSFTVENNKAWMLWYLNEVEKARPIFKRTTLQDEAYCAWWCLAIMENREISAMQFNLLRVDASSLQAFKMTRPDELPATRVIFAVFDSHNKKDLQTPQERYHALMTECTRQIRL